MEGGFDVWTAPQDQTEECAVIAGRQGFRPPYQAPQADDLLKMWSEWQDLRMRPPTIDFA
jgi:hypothetical protein